jgi:hypothetical protein
MTANLYTILTRVRVGGSEQTRHYLVYNLGSVLYMTIVDGVGWSGRDVFCKYARKNLKCLRT